MKIHIWMAQCQDGLEIMVNTFSYSYKHNVYVYLLLFALFFIFLLLFLFNLACFAHFI